MSDMDARAEAERRHARGELYRLDASSRITTFVEGAEWARARVLALAREGIKAQVPLRAWPVEPLVYLDTTLAVLDRLEER